MRSRVSTWTVSVPPSEHDLPTERQHESYLGKESLTNSMVEVATVTSKGQVTLPASIRRKLGLRKGSKLIFLEEGREVRLLAGGDLEKRFALFDRRAMAAGVTRR